MSTIELASAAALLAGAVLICVCAVCWPRTLFGKMFLIGIAFFIGISFADESKKVLPVAIVGGAFSLIFLLVGIRAALRCARGAGAQVWQRAGMSGIYLNFQSGLLTGSRARRFWGMQALCAMLIFAGMAGGTSRKIWEISTAPPPKPKRVQIINANDRYDSLNQVEDRRLIWPSPEIKQQAGENAWGNWRPKNGDRGIEVGEMIDKNSDTYFILKIEDGKDQSHYVPMGIGGFKRLEAVE